MLGLAEHCKRLFITCLTRSGGWSRKLLNGMQAVRQSVSKERGSWVLRYYVSVLLFDVFGERVIKLRVYFIKRCVICDFILLFIYLFFFYESRLENEFVYVKIFSSEFFATCVFRIVCKVIYDINVREYFVYFLAVISRDFHSLEWEGNGEIVIFSVPRFTQWLVSRMQPVATIGRKIQEFEARNVIVRYQRWGLCLRCFTPIWYFCWRDKILYSVFFRRFENVYLVERPFGMNECV